MKNCPIDSFTLPWVLLSAALSFSCGSTSSSSSYLPPSSSPSPPSSPSPAPATVNVAGTWTGTLESSNFASRIITLEVVQGGTCVDGAWKTSSSEWNGAISGYADSTSFSGSISIERVTDKCTAATTISGDVGTNTLKWTSAGFPGGCSGGAFPQSVILTLQRQ